MSSDEAGWRYVGIGLGVTAVLLIGSLLVRSWLDARALTAFEEANASRAAVEMVDLGQLADDVVETSGLAVSRARPGVLWTHNDSGDEPRIYQLDTTGAVLATYSVTNATAIDWEAMDLGVCPGQALEEVEAWCLYMGDIGDNERRRAHVTIYVVREPSADPAGGELQALGRIRLRYPSTPQDAEGLAIGPDGALILITKGLLPQEILFEIDAQRVLAAMEADEIIELSEGVGLGIVPDYDLGRAATGAALSPDGTVLAVKTYSEIYFYRWPITGEPEAAAPTCFLGQAEPQGEAVAFWTLGRLLLASEDRGGREGRLLAVRCREVA